MNCPNCKSQSFSKTLKSYSEVNYKKCINCKCFYQDPIIKLNYSESYWQEAVDPDGVKRNFLEERDFKIKNWYGETIKFVNSKKNISVLDVGCGLGYFLSSLNSDIKKFGVEDSKFACDYIKKNFKDINILNGDVKLIEKFNMKFDIVMFYHVIEHLKDPAEAIKLIKKILKKDGILIVGTPNIDSLVAKMFGKNYRHLIPAHICLYSINSLTNLLEKNNFEIVKIEKPFFKTQYNKLSNYIKLLFVNKLSPPFYGSIFTLHCRNL